MNTLQLIVEARQTYKRNNLGRESIVISNAFFENLFECLGRADLFEGSGWEQKEIPSDKAGYVYNLSIGVAKTVGCRFSDGSTDHPVWRTLGDMTEALRQVLTEHYHLQLEEVKLQSPVQDAEDLGYIEEVELDWPLMLLTEADD